MPQPTITRPRWLSPAEAATYLGVTERTLRNYVRSGAFKAYKAKGSRLIRYDVNEIDAAMRPVPSAKAG